MSGVSQKSRERSPPLSKYLILDCSRRLYLQSDLWMMIVRDHKTHRPRPAFRVVMYKVLCRSGAKNSRGRNHTHTLSEVVVDRVCTFSPTSRHWQGLNGGIVSITKRARPTDRKMSRKWNVSRNKSGSFHTSNDYE